MLDLAAAAGHRRRHHGGARLMASRDATIRLDFGDDEHAFRLRIGELRELQELCDAGPPLVLTRLASHAYKVEDVRETLRLGLIGGGMVTTDAVRLVRRYCDELPAWGENAKLAYMILGAALFGPEDEPLGKPVAASGRKTKKTASASPRSTEAGQ